MNSWWNVLLAITITVLVTGCSLTDKNLLSSIKLHQVEAELYEMEAQKDDNWSGVIPIIDYHVYLEVPKKFKEKNLENLGVQLKFDDTTFKIYGVSGTGIGSGGRFFLETDHPDYNIFEFVTGQGGSHLTEEQIEYLINNTQNIEVELYWKNELVHTLNN